LASTYVRLPTLMLKLEVRVTVRSKSSQTRWPSSSPMVATYPMRAAPSTLTCIGNSAPTWAGGLV